MKPVTQSRVESMKREAKRLGRAQGIPHRSALELIAKARGYESWKAVTVALGGCDTLAPSQPLGRFGGGRYGDAA